MRISLWIGGLSGLFAALGGCSASETTDAEGQGAAISGPASFQAVQQFVVIYMENHSFDNLYGEFPGAEGLAAAAQRPRQSGGDGAVLASLPFPTPAPGVKSAFPASVPNAPFAIETFVPASAPTPDLHHIFFTEQRQINEGRMDRFVHWSDAKALTMGFYHTMTLPVPKVVANYTLFDHFHHAAFGGSFLNHQWLVAARSPVFPSAPASMLDDPSVLLPAANEGQVTKDGFVVNTAFSAYPPNPYFAVPAENRVPGQTHDTIGDRLTDANIPWAWYSGGWNAAMAASEGKLAADAPQGPKTRGFQYHHQPLAYFERYKPGSSGRAHLKDEQEFLEAASKGALPSVSFVKPVGVDNEHPGYADVLDGDKHLFDLIQAVMKGPQWQTTAIIVAYDENGGFWDHVAPPKTDDWGPGSRVPAFVIAARARKSYVDHTPYDTTSILATIEQRFSLRPLTTRDASAKSLTAAFEP